ncbi:MAG: hypothetical protein V5A44_04150 [Haloarculaceae archaeon]
MVTATVALGATVATLAIFAALGTWYARGRVDSTEAYISARSTTGDRQRPRRRTGTRLRRGERVMALGATAFTVLMWANVLLVLAAFAYEVYAIVTEFRAAAR